MRLPRALESRHVPPRYLEASYYQIWLEGLETLLLERGLLSERELESGRSAGPALPDMRPLGGSDVPEAVERGGSARAGDVPGRFRLGDQVRVRNRHPRGHTRAPRYVRGRTGTIERHHGTFVFPDANAHGRGPQPQPLYSVRFAAAELWGKDGDPDSVVYVDLWEEYLDPAPSIS